MRVLARERVCSHVYVSMCVVYTTKKRLVSPPVDTVKCYPPFLLTRSNRTFGLVACVCGEGELGELDGVKEFPLQSSHLSQEHSTDRTVNLRRGSFFQTRCRWARPFQRPSLYPSHIAREVMLILSEASGMKQVFEFHTVRKQRSSVIGRFPSGRRPGAPTAVSPLAYQCENKAVASGTLTFCVWLFNNLFSPPPFLTPLSTVK